ncbi:MAG: polysaccharide biosynthesis C-terminal domain-containing protein [bacterium]|nr:polysaccharide biosynthesis C-terminal domain-containing protein [bacterium]
MRPTSVRRNATANLVAFLVPLAISFFVSPFLIHTLGDSRYGAWALLGELTGYYGLFDAGIRGAVGYYVARHCGDREWSRLNQIVTLAFWALSAAAAAVMVLGLSIAWRLPALIRTGDTDPMEIRIAAAIMVVVVAFNLPLSLYAAFLNGFRRVDLLVYTELIPRLLATTLIVVMVRLGYSLIAMSVINGAATALTWLFQYVFARRSGASISLFPVRFERSLLKDLFAVSGATVILNATITVINQVQPIIIGAYLGTSWLTYFVVARQLSTYYHYFIATIPLSLTTTFTSYYFTGQKDALARLYLVATRITGALAVFVGCSIVIFGRPFLGLWVGEKYISGSWALRSDVVLVLLIVGTVPRTFQNTSAQLLLATRKLRFFTVLRVAEAVVNVGCTLLLVRPLALAGVSLASAVPMIVSHVLLFWYVLREFAIPLGVYWREALLPALRVNVLPVATAVILVLVVPPVKWRLMIGEVIAVSMVALWSFRREPTFREESRKWGAGLAQVAGGLWNRGGRQ